MTCCIIRNLKPFNFNFKRETQIPVTLVDGKPAVLVLGHNSIYNKIGKDFDRKYSKHLKCLGRA